MTGLLDRLEQSNFVVRKHSERDRRIIVVELTEEAKNIFRSIYQKDTKNQKFPAAAQ